MAMTTDLLVTRGATADEVALVARTAWGVLTHAVGAWRAAPGTPLQSHVDRSFTLLGEPVMTWPVKNDQPSRAGGEQTLSSTEPYARHGNAHIISPTTTAASTPPRPTSPSTVRPATKRRTQCT